MPSIVRNKTFLITIICIVIGASLYSENESEQNKPSTTDRQENKASIYAENAKYTFYDENGFSSHLISKETLFYPKSDKIQIVEPYATFSNEEGEMIELKSNKGNFDQARNILVLQGEVLIHQDQPADKAWSISGSEFVIDKEQGFISSDQEVTIKQDRSVMTAIGLKGNLHEKRIDLLSNVRGQYEFNN
jgi:lipopolysaccharide export system protein LptC